MSLYMNIKNLKVGDRVYYLDPGPIPYSFPDSGIRVGIVEKVSGSHPSFGDAIKLKQEPFWCYKQMIICKV